MMKKPEAKGARDYILLLARGRKEGGGARVLCLRLFRVSRHGRGELSTC